MTIQKIFANLFFQQSNKILKKFLLEYYFLSDAPDEGGI